ncbi:fimbrial protein [Providencia burhodogranariea]|uniref:Fimbrial protein n=1 Tax=Providencia burhodogranariea DSM 19968 TaxID=1141662 RepID=K8X890_9GAMM|nr:fimbrial protein [Providencia burhodogranariea DSM 19968]
MKIPLAAIILLASLMTSNEALSNCKPETTITAPPIIFNLSTELNSISTNVTKTSRTQFPGEFICNTGLLAPPNIIGIASPFRSGTATIGFNGGRQFVSISVMSLEKDRVVNIPAGGHPASDLDTHFTIQFTLLNNRPSANYTEIQGDTTTILPVVLASDASSLGILTWLLTIVTKLLTFLLTLQWPIDTNDIFLQPIQITYKPMMTTCNFSNSGLIVSLPLININEVKTAHQPGYTPFTLNFTCTDLIGGINTSRDISMFLQSNNLLNTDNTVLKNTLTQGATGVGFRVVKASNINNPLIFSNSISAQNSATNIFSITSGSPLSPVFSINMGAYYYPYDINRVTQGYISSTATLVLSYN